MSIEFFEECVKTFESMDSNAKSKCEETWNRISLNVQQKKLDENGIFNDEKRNQILTGLKTRPSFLVHVAMQSIAQGHDIKTIAEVGTAQGLQSIVFSETLKDAKIYTCDIKDDRDKNFSIHENIRFVSGDSTSLNTVIKEEKQKVDFCWIDGSHEHYAVLDDFLSLVSLSHSSTIWAFDDYDKRFGCFTDISVILRHFREKAVLDLGLTASGNPNRIVLTRGML